MHVACMHIADHGLLAYQSIHTVNMERFPGTNFHGFEEYRETFFMNKYKLCIIVLLIDIKMCYKFL